MEYTCAKFKIGDKVKFSENGGFYTTYISMAIILGLDKYQSYLDPDISMTFTVIGFNSEDEIYALKDDLGREFMASDKYAELVNQWTIYSNTMPLCELTDEQKSAIFNSWVKGGARQICNGSKFVDIFIGDCNWHAGVVYRIKPKSERDLFIDKSIKLVTPENYEPMNKMFGALFDAGARYKDLTQHFGENI